MIFNPLNFKIKFVFFNLITFSSAIFFATYAQQDASEIQGKQILMRMEDFSTKKFSNAKDNETFYKNSKAEIKRIKELLKSYRQRIEKMDPCSKGYMVSMDNYNYLVQENCHNSVDTIHTQHSVGNVIGGSIKGFIGGGIKGTIKGGLIGLPAGAVIGCVGPAFINPWLLGLCPVGGAVGTFLGPVVGGIAGGAIGSGVGAVKGAFKGKEGDEELFLFSSRDRANNCANMELTPKVPKKNQSCEDIASFQAPACLMPSAAPYNDMIGTIESY